jgi:NAD(P)H-flavin reductase
MPTQLKLRQRHRVSQEVEQVFFEPDQPVQWLAGQYLELLVPGESGLYYTIGNAPSRVIELHMDIATDSGTAARLLSHIEQAGSVAAEVGHGRCHVEQLPHDQTPVLLIASGTGFSQVKSFVEALLEAPPRPIFVYWAVRHMSGLYLADLAQSWADQYEWVHFAAVVSDQVSWHQGVHALYACIAEQQHDWSQANVVCCGSPEMVYSTLDALVAQGLDAGRFWSDMLDFAPRPAQIGADSAH